MRFIYSSAKAGSICRGIALWSAGGWNGTCADPATLMWDDFSRCELIFTWCYETLQAATFPHQHHRESRMHGLRTALARVLATRIHIDRMLEMWLVRQKQQNHSAIGWKLAD